MEVRTEPEIKAYVEGWNACHRQFCECMKARKSVIDAVRKMELYTTAVNGVVEWCESHGELIRCKNCAIRYTDCPMAVRTNGMISFFTEDDDYCSRAVKREVEDELY